MQISFKRSGGFTGIPMAITVDTNALPATEAAQLQRLVEAANFFQLPTKMTAAGQVDRFQYQIAIEENGQQHSVTVSESALPDPLRPLVEWLSIKMRSG